MLDDPSAEVPIRLARVTLSGAPGAAVETQTDDNGRFVFDTVGPGRYIVLAQKPAYLDTAWGALHPGGPGVPLTLAAGQTVSGLELRMARGGVVTGMVRHADGSPAAGATVSARHAEAVAGVLHIGRVETTSGSAEAVTDARGTYRLYGLPPGRFLIQASPPRRTLPPSRAQSAGQAKTFHPAATSPDAAQVIELTVGQELTGVDVLLQAVPLARVSGGIVRPADREIEPPTVALKPVRIDEDAQRLRVDVLPGDTFVGPAIAPGRYRLSAIARQTDPSAGSERVEYWAAREISVDGQDLDGLVLALQPGVRVSGRVEFDAAPPSGLADVSVRLIDADAPGSITVPTARLAADGSFTFGRIAGGRYRWIAPAFGGWTLKGITAVTDAAADWADAPVVIDGSVEALEVRVAYSRRIALLVGTLTDTRGALATDYAVVVASANPAERSRLSRRVQTVRPGTDGQFVFGGLPPGDYVLGVVTGIELARLFDPGILSRLDETGIRVTVPEEGTIRQDLQLAR